MQTQNNKMTELEKIRKEIDQINREIASLLNKRLELALKALAYKNTIMDKTRETEILQQFSSDYLKSVFQQILNSTRKEQAKKL